MRYVLSVFLSTCMLSVGEILRLERTKKGITLPEVEKKIRVRVKFLEAIERNDWRPFASKVYISGIIQSYAHFLGLDEVKLLAFFRRDYDSTEDMRFKKKVKSDYLTPQTKKIAVLSVVLLVGFFIIYFAYQLKIFLSPPAVTVLQPLETEFRREERIIIVGKTDREAAVSIFGERVYQDSEGVFRYDFPLKKGKNDVTIEVVGANGKKTTLKKTYLKL